MDRSLELDFSFGKPGDHPFLREDVRRGMWTSCVVDYTLLTLAEQRACYLSIRRSSDSAYRCLTTCLVTVSRSTLGCDGTSSGFLAYLYTNLLLVFAAIAPTLLFMPLMMVRGRAAHSGAPEEVYNRRIRFNLQIWSRRAMREPQKQSPIRSDRKQSSVSSTAGADGSNHAEGEFDRAENPEPMDEELDQADAAHVAARKDGASSNFLRWRDRSRFPP